MYYRIPLSQWQSEEARINWFFEMVWHLRAGSFLTDCFVFTKDLEAAENIYSWVTFPPTVAWVLSLVLLVRPVYCFGSLFMNLLVVSAAQSDRPWLTDDLCVYMQAWCVCIHTSTYQTVCMYIVSHVFTGCRLSVPTVSISCVSFCKITTFLKCFVNIFLRLLHLMYSHLFQPQRERLLRYTIWYCK